MELEVIEELNEIVEELMKEKNVGNYEIKIQGNTESGENFMGDLIFFKVIPENAGKTCDYVMKTAKRSDELRKSIPLEATYKRELYVYKEIFPSFREFLMEKNCPFELDFVPRVHYICEEAKKETLILTDLKSDGYKLWDRTKPWNMEHILLLMKNYGKFNGISLAFRDQRPEIFARLTKPMHNLNLEYNKAMDTFQFYNEPLLEVIQSFREFGRLDLAEKYEGFENNVDFVRNCDTDENDKSVICHGDGWNNNFMFKYVSNKRECARPDSNFGLDFLA